MAWQHCSTPNRLTPSRSSQLPLAGSRSRSSAFVQTVLNRQLGGARVSRRALLECMACEEAHGVHFWDMAPPFCIDFHPSPARPHLAAIGDEEGTITLLDASMPAAEGTGGEPSSANASYLRGAR